ncbi:MAG: T9SS type A sorting domain-containing protein [Reichenbachiella sp.]|uniref:T9SS type A sorting domain-containing protein n=1 Tax=Reichenbachiella sp. TaxID=2184521 RepID=UPI003265CFED
MRIITAIFFTLLTCNESYAADRYWIAGTSANWNNTDNWSTTSGGSSGASIPGSSDLVYFDVNGLGNCSIDAVVNIDGLNIDAAYTGNITQSLGNSITVGANHWIQSGGIFMAETTLITVNGNLTLDNATLTHSDNSSTEIYKLNLTVTGNLTLSNGATMDVNELGYDEENGPGTSSALDGAGHGGIGGDEGNNGVTSSVYGSYIAPTTIGSGGSGYSNNISGGGAVLLDVGQTLNIDATSSITANGSYGPNGGGGSGGSIFITAGSIISSGSITCNGGGASNGRGGGGGGRVAVILTNTLSDFSLATGPITTYGGNSNGSLQDGAAGTVYLEEETDVAGGGELIIDNNNLSADEEVVFTPIPSGETWEIYELKIQNNGILRFPSGTTLDLKNDNITSDDSDNVLKWEGTLLIPSTFTIDNWTLVLIGAQTIASDVTLTNGGSIIHEDNSTAESSTLDLTVNGNLTLSNGGNIIADGLGYDARYGPGTPSGNSYDGGGHGGIGGDNQLNTTTASAYGSFTAPVNIGSGGDHASGGGAVRLIVSQLLNIDNSSSITVNGSDANGGAGAGGSIFITTGTISSTGIIAANGGASTSHGGGAGGRISIILTATSADFASAGTISAYGGNSNGNGEDGAAGTVYLEEEADSSGAGALIIDNNDLYANDQAVYTPIPSGDTWIVYELIIKNKGIFGFPIGTTLDLQNDNIVSDDPTNIINWDGNLICPATFTIDNWTLRLNEPKTITADVSIVNGGSMTHLKNSTTESYKLDLTINGDLTLSSATINADGLGYDAEAGPGKPVAGSYDGGSYGGIGGDDAADGTAQEVYGSFLAPVNIGSGGRSGSGGGAINLTISQDLTIDATSSITAQGATASGSGSGGSVFITTGTISCSGIISADGGGSGNSRGAGGGGRVAIVLTGVSADFVSVSGTITAYGGDSDGSGKDGAAGTVYLEKDEDNPNEGKLIIDNNGLDVNPGIVYTPLTSDVSLSSLILNNAGVISLESFDLTIANGNPDAIDFDASSFVLSESTDGASKLVWQIDQTTGTYIIPFGASDGTDLSFTFDVTSSGINDGGTGELSVATYPTADDNTPYPTGVTNTNNEAGDDSSENALDRFWIIDLINYSTNPTADLTFSYDEADLLGNEFSEELMVSQRYDKDIDEWVLVGGNVNTTTNQLSVSNVNTFSPWTLSNMNSPLPIALLAFDAQVDGQNVELRWTTASEVNNDYFTLERSTDAANFNSVANLPGAGNSNTRIDYYYVDQTLLTSKVYYRLKQTDLDGIYTYSGVVDIDILDIHLFSLYPNPCTEPVIYLEFFKETDLPVTIEIFGSDGTKFLEQNFINSSQIAIQLDNNIKPGAYHMIISMGSQKYFRKVLIAQ